MKIRASAYIAPDLIAAVPTILDDEAPYSRFLMFQNTTDEQVADVDIPRTTVDACAYAFESTNENIFVVLTNEGDVYFMTEEVFDEKIPGAGVLSEDAEDLGSTLGIRHRNGTLYVCGDGSQVYYRPHENEWVRLCERGHDGMADNFLEAIDAFSPSRIAVCGYTRGESRGCLCLLDKGRWQTIELPNNQYMHDVIFVDALRFVSVGGGGTIVVGTRPEDVENVSIPDVFEKLRRVRFDRDKLHILGDTAVYVLDLTFTLLDTVLLPSEYDSPKNLEVKDGVMWYFDRHGAARHDGEQWQMMPISPELLQRPAD